MSVDQFLLWVLIVSMVWIGSVSAVLVYQSYVGETGHAAYSSK